MAARLMGKIALITGGASGIGRATALLFAKEGAKVVVSDIDVSGGERTVRDIVANGSEALFIKADVSQEADVDRLVSATVERFGRLDCAFNNAGIEGSTATTANCSNETWTRTLAVNLTGVWMCMRAEIRQMLRQGSGAIVNTASVAGLAGFAGLPAYVASKHGVVGLTRCAALEYAKNGIRINAVCPGVIQTPMIERLIQEQRGAENLIAMEPVGRLGTPEEIADAVAWLCSDGASFVVGLPLPVDGGFIAR